MKTFGILTALLCLLNCTGQAQVNIVSKDIQKGLSKKPVLAYYDIKKAVLVYKLINLEQGFDSLAIRIWFDMDTKTRHAILIQRSFGNWKGQLWTFTDSGRFTFFGIVPVHFLVKSVEPANRWTAFIPELLSQNIVTLTGSGVGTDGTLTFVEISSKKQYRFYEYWDGDVSSQHSAPVNKMDAIMRLIKSRFKID